MSHLSSAEEDDQDTDSVRVHSATMGNQQLPEGIELALNSMPVGEKASFVLPAKLLQLAGTSEPWQDVPGAEGHELVQVIIELDAMQEVRDMTGDGKVGPRYLGIPNSLNCRNSH